MTWIYSQTNSLFLGIPLHASFTGGQLLLWPTAASPRAELVWYGAFSCGLVVVAALVILVSRRVASVAASAQEKTRTMPGVSIVQNPLFTVTHGITIDAPAERIWPWLLQTGSDFTKLA